VRGCDLANDWSVAPSMLRIRVHVLPHGILRESVALHVVRSAPKNGIDSRADECRGGWVDRRSSTLAAGSVDRRSAQRCRACESGWSAMATDQELVLLAPADHVRSDRLTEEVRRAGDSPERADVPGAMAIARCEESLPEPLNAFCRRLLGGAFRCGGTICQTAVTSAWSLEAASSALGPSREISNSVATNTNRSRP